MTPLDDRVATILAQTAQQFRPALHGRLHGLAFEQRLFAALEAIHPWRHAAGPDQFNLGLALRSRTGTRYEFDGVFDDGATLYVVEAKIPVVTRELVGIFAVKLLDLWLGSQDEIGDRRLMPVLVGAATAEAAARLYAAAWGIMLITPDRPTPQAIAAACDHARTARHATELQRHSRALAAELWRPFNAIVSPRTATLFNLDTTNLYDEQQTMLLLEQWDELVLEAHDAGLFAGDR